VGVCLYEESLFPVKRLIESLKDHVRKIIVVDGIFKDFDSKNKLSSDDVRNYLNSIDNVVLLDAPDLREPEKRQLYLNTDADYIFIMDSDTWVKSADWDSVYKQLEAFNPERDPEIHHVEVEGSTRRNGSCFPKLWFRPKEWEYLKTHNFWKNKVTGDVFKSTLSGKHIQDILVKTNDIGRGADYILRTRSYQGKLMAYEKPLKDEYRKIAKNAAPPKEYFIPGVPMV